MRTQTVVSLAGLVALAATSSLPAHAAKPKPKPKPKPITQTYSMQLAPVPDPPSGTSCVDPMLEGISMHTVTIKTAGAGVLSAKVNGFSGDWDISVTTPDGEVIGVGDGTTTGGGVPAQKGEDTLELSFKRPETLQIRMCNFAGTPTATGTFTYTYK